MSWSRLPHAFLRLDFVEHHGAYITLILPSSTTILLVSHSLVLRHPVTHISSLLWELFFGPITLNNMLLLSLPLTLSFACLSSIVLADIAPYNASRLYDLGIFGAYPHRKFMTVDYEAPRVNIKQWSDQCEDGRYILLTPRGRYVSNSGPMLLDNKGNMVWSGKEFGMVSDLKVQRYRGEEYLTFWTGHDDGTHGHGVYHMVSCQSSCDLARPSHLNL